MNRGAREYNETVIPNSAQIERLRSAFPKYFDAQGSFMLDQFEEMLKEDDLNLTREGYELKFLGKSYAKYLAGLETETVVVPDLEHNAEPENKDSENLYIVGDNLDALQHLVKSYAGKVKCIYIDPPYNTGSDGFVYNDDFCFTIQQLVERIGVSEDEAERILDMQGKSSHSAWLTFMYPRLMLARELLSGDGVIFISIDDNEQADLRMICDEIFGEQSFVGSLIHQRAKGGGLAKNYVKGHDMVHVYCRASSDSAPPLKRPKVIQGEVVVREGVEYLRSDDVLRKTFGKYERGTERRCLYEEIIQYHGESKKQEIDRRISRGELELEPYSDGKSNLIVKYIKLDDAHSALYSLLPTIQALPDDRLEELGISELFSYPKPLELLRILVRSITQRDAGEIVCDFFSGSATTADAIMQLNAKDGGNRRYIMVQLPELIDTNKPAYKNGFRTIDEIGRERIKRAGASIKAGTGVDIDYGFKLVRLETPSTKTLDELDEFNPNIDGLLAGDYVSKFNLDGTPGHDVVLTTWMNQDGFGLLAKPRKVELDNYVLDVCEDSAYIINPGIKSGDVQELVRLLETNELQLSRVVVFPYSVTFSVMHELKKNLSVLKSGQNVKVIERF